MELRMADRSLMWKETLDMTSKKVMIDETLIQKFLREKAAKEEHRLYNESLMLEREQLKHTMSARSASGERIKMHWGGK